MSGNALKTPFIRSLNRAAQKRALDAIQTLGKALPASVIAVSGSIVTVKFELSGPYTLPQVTCPMFGPEYIRYPTQVGDKGVVFPADAYLGGITGLGGGIADLTIPANLSALVFFPVANKGWSASDDPNAVVIYGPDGAIVRNTANTASIKLASSGITLSDSHGNIIAMGSSGIKFTSGGVTVGATTHDHSGVQTGAGTSGPPVPGT